MQKDRRDRSVCKDKHNLSSFAAVEREEKTKRSRNNLFNLTIKVRQAHWGLKEWKRQRVQIGSIKGSVHFGQSGQFGQSGSFGEIG